jgi:hypothetical protein
VTFPTHYLEEELNDEPPPMGELGSSFAWNDTFGGYDNGKVFEVPEPGLVEYQEMLDTDGKAANIEQMLTYPIVSAPWEIAAALDEDDTVSNGGKADEIRQFVLDAMTDLPHQGGPRTTIEQFVSQMTIAFTQKKSIFERFSKRVMVRLSTINLLGVLWRRAR